MIKYQWAIVALIVGFLLGLGIGCKYNGSTTTTTVTKGVDSVKGSTGSYVPQVKQIIGEPEYIHDTPYVPKIEKWVHSTDDMGTKTQNVDTSKERLSPSNHFVDTNKKVDHIPDTGKMIPLYVYSDTARNPLGYAVINDTTEGRIRARSVLWNLSIPTTTTTTITKDKPKKWGIGAQFGYGITGKQLSPFFGVGVSYNLIKW